MKKKTLRSTLYIPNAEKITKSLQRVRDGTDWSCDSYDYEDGILIMDVKNGRNHYEIDFVFNPSGQMLREVDCARICVSHNDGLGEFLSAPCGKTQEQPSWLVSHGKAYGQSRRDGYR